MTWKIINKKTVHTILVEMGENSANTSREHEDKVSWQGRDVLIRLRETFLTRMKTTTKPSLLSGIIKKRF